MKCPFCSFEDSKVVDSRPTDEGTSIRRRRECLHCGKRFTTYETVERMPLMLIKRDGTRQAYDRQKLLNGLIKACEKRPGTRSRRAEAVRLARKRGLQQGHR